MKTMLMAAAALLCMGVGAAYADGGDTEGGAVPNTYFTELPGVIAQQGEQPNNVAANQYGTPPAATAVAVPPTAISNGS